MTLPTLTLIPAGAGSGKTYTIQKALAQWVVDGHVAPQRILAVTFTEAAASEMRERIRTELVARDLLEEALLLDQASISTIHSFGMRLLGEFAFEAGVSPQPRLLLEHEEKAHLQMALASSDKADPILNDLTGHGYDTDFVKKTGTEDVFKERALQILGMLRSIGQSRHNRVLVETALKQIRALYGKTGRAEPLNKALHNAVSALLRAHPNDLSPLFAGNKTAVGAFREDFRALKRAATGAVLSRDWSLWRRLQNLRCSKRGSPTPEGYDDLAEAVMQAASALPSHPGPLDHALIHMKSLVETAQDVLVRYGASKRSSQLVDFADMIAESHALMIRKPELVKTLRERIDCLVIDEFQDTNPLQFSLLWRLHKAGVPTLIVGDLKQAIMGFQHADSRLLEALQEQNPRAVNPLTGNWRSSKALMSFINTVGTKLFGKGYTALTPKADFPSKTAALEFIDAPDFIRGDKTRAAHTVARIYTLLSSDEEVIWDRHAKVQRRLRGGDIAILYPVNDKLEDYANLLSQLGIRTVRAHSGWFSSPPVRLLYHALCFVADPTDRHAALFLAVTELGEGDLGPALESLMDFRLPEEPLLDTLAKLGVNVPEQGVASLVDRVIRELDLYTVVAEWPDSEQMRANLLRFQAEAREFMNLKPETLRSSGLYGFGLKTFLAWVKIRSEQDDSQPVARVEDHDAVVLTTWHSAKGREWPVVAVCGLQRSLAPRFPHFGIDYPDFSDLTEILERAQLELIPQFMDPATQVKFAAKATEQSRVDARRLLYVALTRAREKLILEWPSYHLDREESKEMYLHLLARETGLTLGEKKVVIGRKSFPCQIFTATRELPAILDPSENEEKTIKVSLPTVGRRAIPAALPMAAETPEQIAPSQLQTSSGSFSGKSRIFYYGKGLSLDLSLSPSEQGTLLHRCFELLGWKPELADELGALTGHPFTDLERQQVAGAVAGFEQWVEQHMQPQSIQREMPILVLDGKGSVVSGKIDMVVRNETGYWIIDHKTDHAEDFTEAFRTYWPQLSSYVISFRRTKPKKPVLGVAIHWIRHGSVQRVGLKLR